MTLKRSSTIPVNRRHREKPDVKKVLWRLPRLMPVLILMIVLLIGVRIWRALSAPGALPFHRVTVSANADYISKADLSALVTANVEGGFFSLNTEKLKQALTQNPWIESVGIRRVWPSTLAVSIKEREPVALWGENGVVSAAGDIFYPTKKNIPTQMLAINGPLTEKDNILDTINKMQALLALQHLKIAKIDVSDRLAWTLTLANGIVVAVGRDNLLSKLRSFVNLYPTITKDNKQNITSVNLCYPNGLAVRRNSQSPSFVSNKTTS